MRANAAWLRPNAILYNLLSAFKRVGLPEEFHTARPKRLRFLLPNTVGKVVRHARESLLRCTERSPEPLPARRAPNRKFKRVAILPLWLRQHTSLKNLKMPVASIDSKPSPDSI